MLPHLTLIAVAVAAGPAPDQLRGQPSEPSSNAQRAGEEEAGPRAAVAEAEAETARETWVLLLAGVASAALGVITGPIGTGGLALSVLYYLLGTWVFAPVFLAVPMVGLLAVGALTLGTLLAATYFDPSYERLYGGAAIGGALGLLGAGLALPVGVGLGVAVAVAGVLVGVLVPGPVSAFAGATLYLAGGGIALVLATTLPAAAFGGGIAAGLFIAQDLDE